MCGTNWRRQNKVITQIIFLERAKRDDGKCITEILYSIVMEVQKIIIMLRDK